MHLQDNFLNKVIEENISVSIYLLNGIKLQGNQKTIMSLYLYLMFRFRRKVKDLQNTLNFF